MNAIWRNIPIFHNLIYSVIALEIKSVNYLFASHALDKKKKSNICLTNIDFSYNIDPSAARGSEYPETGGPIHIFSDGRKPDTAFQRFRNSRLSGEFHSEITGRSLSECLDECLRQTSFQCRSAVYSEHYRTCRLSRFNQKDGHRIIYDADNDYYENLMRESLLLSVPEIVAFNNKILFNYENYESALEDY